MPFVSEFLTVVIVHFFSLLSPGADFVMTSRNSLMYSRKIGVYSAVGLGLGILVHVTYSLIGIGLIISKSVLLFSTLKFIGAAYLMYVGYTSLQTKSQPAEKIENKNTTELEKYAAIRMGFFTNITNPQASLFILALFTQVVSPQTPKVLQMLYGLEMSLATFAWYACVATVLSNSVIKTRFSIIQPYLGRAFGVILIALGVKVALSSSL